MADVGRLSERPKTPGSASARSSAIRPGPTARPQAPCSQTAAEAASNGAMSWAARPVDEAGEHIARAGGGEPGRQVPSDGRAAVGRGDHRVGALDQDHGAHEAGRRAGAGELVVVEPDAGAPSNSFMNSPSCGVITASWPPRLISAASRVGFACEACQRVGVEHDRALLGGPGERRRDELA